MIRLSYHKSKDYVMEGPTIKSGIEQRKHFGLCQDLGVTIIIRRHGKNRECPVLRIFGYCLCPLGEMMKFSMNKKYNGKSGKVLNNPQLNTLYPSEEQRIFKLSCSIFSIV